MPRFKSTPDDFVVEEIPAYAPSGAGEHLYVTFTKRNQNTDAVVRRMAEALRVNPRDVGVAGLKDKIALTTQTVSFPLGPALGAEAAEAGLRALQSPDLRVDAVSRHGNKLRTGHLRGNRFSLWVRAANADEIRLALERVERAKREGLPNSFGDQRFGRYGDNAERALAFVRGEQKPPRDPRQARFLFSAFQSLLFNTLLDDRVVDGSWAIPAAGELVMRHRSTQGDEEERGALFLCTDDEIEEVRARALRHEVSPTGPLWGAKMRKPSSAALDREMAVLARFGVEESMLQRFSKLGEGVRRSLRLFPEALEVHTEPAAASSAAPGAADETDMQLQFVLPKGAYATEVLAWVFPGGFDAPERPGSATPPPSSSSRTSP